MSDTPPDRIARLPIAYFAVVMGLCGLTLAWEKALAVLGWPAPWLTAAMTAICAGVYGTLAVGYGLKSRRHWPAVRAELDHPISLSFFPAVSIGLILIATCCLSLAPGLSRGLWLIGTVLQITLTLFVINTWMQRDHFEIQHLNPAWFIPAVGNVLVPIAGVPHGFEDVSWFFFSIGMLFWIVLMTTVFYRILFHAPLPERLMPSLFILIAPPAVGFLAWMALNGGTLDHFGRFLYFSAAFLALLLLSQPGRFRHLPFALTWWAYTFPSAAFTVATLVMFEQRGEAFYGWLGGLLLFALTVLIVDLSRRTWSATRSGALFEP